MKLGLVLTLLTSLSFAGSPEENVVKQLPRLIEEAKILADSPELVSAVDKANLERTPQALSMNNEKWKSLSVRDPLVQVMVSNPAAAYLRSNVKPYISEAFISKKDGSKVAFLAKTTSWNHSGKPKHEVPMSGKVWKGSLERDESSGIHQIQIGVPILKEGKPIGSLVLGISAAHFQ